MDKKTLHYLFYLAAHQNIRNEMVFNVTEKDMTDLGVTPNEVINCLCGLSYCTGVLIERSFPIVYEVTIIPDVIWVNSPYFHFLFRELCELGTPQEVINEIDILLTVLPLK